MLRFVLNLCFSQYLLEAIFYVAVALKKSKNIIRIISQIIKHMLHILRAMPLSFKKLRENEKERKFFMWSGIMIFKSALAINFNFEIFGVGYSFLKAFYKCSMLHNALYSCERSANNEEEGLRLMKVGWMRSIFNTGSGGLRMDEIFLWKQNVKAELVLFLMIQEIFLHLEKFFLEKWVKNWKY